MLEILLANKEIVITFLLALSELLALNPKVKSNSVFQLIWAGLKKVKEVISIKLLK